MESAFGVDERQMVKVENTKAHFFIKEVETGDGTLVLLIKTATLHGRRRKKEISVLGINAETNSLAKWQAVLVGLGRLVAEF